MSCFDLVLVSNIAPGDISAYVNHKFKPGVSANGQNCRSIPSRSSL